MENSVRGRTLSQTRLPKKGMSYSLCGMPLSECVQQRHQQSCNPIDFNRGTQKSFQIELDREE
jgi:hypothetical protein